MKVRGILGYFSLTILTIMSVGLASPPTELTDTQRAETEKTLRALTLELLDQVNQMNAEGQAEFWSDDYQEAVMGANVVKGKEGLLKRLKNIFRLRVSQKIKREEIKVHVLSPTSAYVLVVSSLSVKFKNGKHFTVPSAWTMIYKKETSGWKMVHSHESSWL